MSSVLFQMRSDVPVRTNKKAIRHRVDFQSRPQVQAVLLLKMGRWTYAAIAENTGLTICQVTYLAHKLYRVMHWSKDQYFSEQRRHIELTPETLGDMRRALPMTVHLLSQDVIPKLGKLRHKALIV